MYVLDYDGVDVEGVGGGFGVSNLCVFFCVFVYDVVYVFRGIVKNVVKVMYC